MGLRAARLLSLVLTSAGLCLAQTCATCHREIAESYARTGMGRSFRAVHATTPIPEIQGGTVHHRASDQFFSLSGNRMKRYQTGFDGATVNLLEASLDYAIGSGNHAVSYLHRTAAGELVELPLTWYPEKGGYWAMSPAYDRPDHAGFGRKVSYRCMFCHNAYPAVEREPDALESGTRFPARMPEGIDCERCHGPGRAHIAAIRRGQSPEAVRSSIVNPARLGSARQMEICLQCHLETTSLDLPGELMRYGRGVFSYRPGEPLADYALYFDHAPGTGHDDKFEIAGAPYRLRKSPCFLASNGALTCTTCHNPHDVPRGAAAVAHYAQVCRGCHQAIHAKQHPDSEDCASCHMPKRRPEDAVHLTMTDHYIRRRPEPSAALPLVERHDGNTPAYRGEVVAYYTPADPLYLAVAQVRHKANRDAGLRQLEAAIATGAPQRGEFYFQLGEAYRDAGQLDKAVAAYREACSRTPAWHHFYGLGTALSAAGQLDGSVEALNRARQSAPQEVVVLHALSATYARQGKSREALATLLAALAIDPDSADTYNNMGVISLEMGKTAEAESYLREAIQRRPEIAAPRLNLGDLLAQRGSLGEAKYHFEAALRVDSSLAAAHSGYAAVLASMGNLASARAQYQEALRLDPQLTEARNNLGSVLLRSGDVAAAIREYRQALSGSPGSATANYNLGLALTRMGNVEGARPYLRKAAESSDPAVRKAAQELLRTPK